MISKIDVEEEDAKALAKNLVPFVNQLQLPLALLRHSATSLSPCAQQDNISKLSVAELARDRCSQTEYDSPTAVQGWIYFQMRFRR